MVTQVQEEIVPSTLIGCLGDRLVKAYPAIRLFFPVESCEIMACSIVSSPGRIVRMDTATDPLDALIRSGARRLTGYRRRAFIAEVATDMCGGNPRQAERRFGWGRETVEKGLHEPQQGMRCLENFAARGRRRSEDKDPQLAADIRAIVEPHTYADPELKSSRRYTNLSAAEVRDALIAKGHPEKELAQRADDAGHPQSDELPPQADPEGQAAEEDRGDRRDLRQREGGAASRPGTIPRRWRSRWTRRRRWPWAITSVGGKTRTDSAGEVPKGWDHDPPAKEKLVPFGILMVATGALMLLFGSHETSDAWVDALADVVAPGPAGPWGTIKRLVIYLDNGPKNSGRRTQFLKRMVQFADWSGLEIRLVYYPPYHSKYNPIERCWSSLEKKWNGVLLNGLEGGPAMRPADEMEGPASDGEAPRGRVPRRCPCPGQGDEGDRGAAGTFGDPAEVRHHHQTESDRAAGKVIAAGRLRTVP